MSIYHKHHIVPRHMGGTDDPSNLVELTIEEHAEAHRKLFEEYGRWQDKLAWKTLSGQITFADAARLARIESNRRRKGSKLSEETKRKISNTTKGRTKSEETKRKMSLGMRGLVRSEEHCRNLSFANKGRKHTEQARKNMGAARIGKLKSEETKRKIRESNVITKFIRKLEKMNFDDKEIFAKAQMLKDKGYFPDLSVHEVFELLLRKKLEREKILLGDENTI